MARTVADCALLENVIAGPHPSDVVSLRPKLEIPDKLDGVEGMRIALSVDLGCYDVDADVAANTLAAADRLRDAGASVHEVALPWDLATIARTVDIHFGMIFGASMKEFNDQFGDQLTSYVRRLVADSELVSKDDFYAGLSLEAEIYAPLGQMLEDYDALICPTFAVPALPAEYDTGDVVAGEREARGALAGRHDDAAFQHREPLSGAQCSVRALEGRGADRPRRGRQDL